MEPREKLKDLSQPIGKRQARGNFLMERRQFKMSVEVEKSGGESDPREFKNLFSGLGGQICACFLNETARNAKSTRSEDMVRRLQEAVGQNEHGSSVPSRRFWIRREVRPRRVSTADGFPPPCGQ